MIKNSYHYFKRNFAECSDFYAGNNVFNKKQMGALPYDWFKNTGKQDKKNITDRVDKAFQEYAEKISDWEISKDAFIPHNKELKENLSSILNRNDIEVEFIKKGFHKNCQKITMGDYSYALLTFRDGSKSLLSEAFANGHGSIIEPSRIFHIYKNYSKGKIAKPFMTRFADNEFSFNGYMLEKFIYPKKLPEPQRYSAIGGKSKLFRFDTMGDNSIDGVIFDIGGARKEPKLLPDDLTALLSKISNYIHQIFYLGGEHFNSARDSEQMLNIAKTSIDVDKIISELLNKNVDIYNQDNREILKTLNETEQRFFLKKVRALKKFHKAKLKLTAEGKYDEYKEFIKKFFPKVPKAAQSILIEAAK